jgi:PhzF family phenazine biosynthesis protein
LESLASIAPDQDSIRAICEKIGSTGLYPYALVDVGEQVVMARQFPKASGYVEDPATGIAAAALAFGLLDAGVLGDARRSVFVRQGWSMGRPSEIEIMFRWEREEIVGCWISGRVEWLVADAAASDS